MVTGNTCIRGTGQTSDYASDQYTIRLQGTDNNYNLISSNNCMGKAPVVGGGTGNTVINNKWNATSDFEDLRTEVNSHGELINSLDADVVAHKAEDASQDNVHGLRSEKVVIGRNSNANDAGSIAIGDGAEATSNQLSSIAIGKNAKTNSSVGRTVVIGENASAGGSSVVIGTDSQVSKGSGIAIGRNAKITTTVSDTHAIAIGRDSLISSGSLNIVLGKGAESSAPYSVAIGYNTITENNRDIVVGINNHHTKIPGDFTVNGTKNFEIPHPKPEKKATHVIRHGAVESPTAGDTLYRFKVESTKENDLQMIDLPDYFIHLNKDVQIFVTPQGHFGNGYGVLNEETEQLEIHCQSEGEYNVLVIGTRNDDHQSVQDWNIKGVEREIGESWTGETYVFSVDEIMEVEEIKEEEVA
jgi:hypothetical protein